MMIRHQHNVTLKRLTSAIVQWAAAALLLVIVLPFALATIIVIALSDAPPDYSQE